MKQNPVKGRCLALQIASLKARTGVIEPGEPGYVIKVLLATSSFAQEINFPLAERSVDKVS